MSSTSSQSLPVLKTINLTDWLSVFVSFSVQLELSLQVRYLKDSIDQTWHHLSSVDNTETSHPAWDRIILPNKVPCNFLACLLSKQVVAWSGQDWPKATQRWTHPIFRHQCQSTQLQSQQMLAVSIAIAHLSAHKNVESSWPYQVSQAVLNKSQAWEKSVLHQP